MSSQITMSPSWLNVKFGIANWRLVARYAAENSLNFGTMNVLALLSIAIGLASAIGLSLITTSSKQVAMQVYQNLALNIITFEIAIEKPTNINQPKPDASSKKDKTAPIYVKNEGQWLEFFDKMVSELTDPLSKRIKSWPVIKTSCESRNKAGSINFDIVGTQPGLLKAIGYTISQGRDIHALDYQKLWIVVTPGFAEQVLEIPLQGIVGKSVLLCGRTYYIAGVASGNGRTAEQAIGVSSLAIYTSTSALRAQGFATKELAIAVDTINNKAAIEFYNASNSYLSKNKADQVRVRTSLSFAEIEKIQNNEYSKLVLLIGLISMIVGAINIANVMSIAVLLRRHNIAICMAFGASSMTIAFEFLVESVILGGAGAILSVLLAYLVAVPVLLWLKMPLIFDGLTVGLAIFTGVVVGALGGIYPAIKIAKIDPAVILAS